MGGSQCVVHGVGSFGAFAAGLAGNQCRAIHRKPSSGAPDPCPNSRGDNFVVNITDKDLVFGEKVSELTEEGMLPAKPQNMLKHARIGVPCIRKSRRKKFFDAMKKLDET
jgi:hypothetical protein